MTSERRCVVGVVGGLVIGSLTAMAILLAPRVHGGGVLFLVFAAVMAVNLLLVGLRAPPLVRLAFTPRQSLIAAPALVVLGLSLLYADRLPTALVVGLGVLGLLALGWAVILGFLNPPPSSAESSRAPRP